MQWVWLVTNSNHYYFTYLFFLEKLYQYIQCLLVDLEVISDSSHLTIQWNSTFLQYSRRTIINRYIQQPWWPLTYWPCPPTYLEWWVCIWVCWQRWPGLLWREWWCLVTPVCCQGRVVASTGLPAAPLWRSFEVASSRPAGHHSLLEISHVMVMWTSGDVSCNVLTKFVIDVSCDACDASEICHVISQCCM